MKIKKITTIKNTNNEPVYNLEVKDNHNYFIENCLVSNCHKAKANELIFISENCINARWRFATSGTVQTERFYRYSIMANFGFAFKSSTTRELIDMGFLTDFHIRSVILNWKNHENKTKKLEIKNYDDEFNTIIENEPRKNLIVKFVTNLWNDKEYEDSTIIVMCKRIEYIEDLYQKLKNSGLKKVFFIHGSISVKERKKVIEYVKIHGGIIIANINIMGTGINIPNVSTIVFANPLKSDILLLQSIGRSIRLHPNKKFANVYDIIDKIPIKNRKENTTYGWYLYKASIFENKKFKYDTLELDFKYE